MTNQTLATIQLQSVGQVPAIPASEIKAGDVRMYNFGSTTLILKVIEKTAKTLEVIEFNPESGNYWISDIRKTTLVAIVERDQEVSSHNPQEANKARKGMIDISTYFPIVKESNLTPEEQLLNSEKITNVEFLELCVKYQIELSYSLNKWCEDKLDLIGLGQYEYRASGKGGFPKELSNFVDELYEAIVSKKEATTIEEVTSEIKKEMVNVKETTNNLIGRKVLGNWGIDAGWENGVITNVETDSFGTDVIINWEENGQKRIDVNELTVTNEYTNIDAVGMYLLAVEDVKVNEAAKQEKNQVESITFNWSESNQVKDGHTVSTFSEAEQIIFNIAVHKTTGGYDKTNFTITWEDGHTYTGRIDVLSAYKSGQELKKHVEAHCVYFAGEAKETDMEQYTNNLRAYGVTEEDQKEYRLFLDTYLLEDIKTTPESEMVTVEATTDVTNEITEIFVNEIEEKQNTTSYQLNTEQNGVEIYFDSKPSEEVRNQLKALKFRWARKKGCWYAKQSDETISFAKQLAVENQVANEAPISYPEIEINDITDSKYSISQSVIDREHDSNWIFRKEKKDYNKEIQEYFTECNNKVLEVISTTSNEYLIFKLKESLQRFKKNYHTQYVRYLTIKGNTPSLAVTGRGGRNMSKYNKDVERQNNVMMELASMPKEFNNVIEKYENKIWKDKKMKIQNKVKSTNMNLEFTTTTKEFEFMGINQKKRVYVSGEYFICKTWGCFRIFNLNNNKEVHSMKTKEKLEDTKRFVAYLVQQDQQKVV